MLSSAAEEHAQALMQQLLESTELAAQSIVGQTRAEGERRIESAGRQAQAIAETVTAVEQAEQALAERATAFADASRALRAELQAFSATLSDGEERLSPQAAAEPDLRLVESPAAQRRPQAPPTGIGQILLAGDVDEVDEDEEPPTPDQIAQFFREHEDAELTRADRRAEAEAARGGLAGRVRRFFTGPEVEEDGEAAATPQELAVVTARHPGRDRLYADIGGAVIGLGGAAALLDFVLLK